jgi:hypothetical protein
VTRCFLRSTLLWVAASGMAVTAAGCAARTLHLPAGTGTPVADAAGLLDAATGDCRAVRTLQAELAISGLAAGERIRGRVIAGFERPSAMRLEAVAPFGPPAFILVSRAGSATLLVPRDARILADAAPAQVIEALTGVSLAPDDLLAVLAGCASNDRQATSAREYANKWVGVDVADGTSLYLRPESGGWRIAAATRGRLAVEYGYGQGRAPLRVHLRVTGEASVVTADLDIRLAQVETNASIDPRAFTLRTPDKAVPLTLDELRRSGPLGPRR